MYINEWHFGGTIGYSQTWFELVKEGNIRPYFCVGNNNFQVVPPSCIFYGDFKGFLVMLSVLDRLKMQKNEMRRANVIKSCYIPLEMKASQHIKWEWVS